MTTYTIGIMQGHERIEYQKNLNDLANILTENKYEVNFYDVISKGTEQPLGDSLGSWFPQNTDLHDYSWTSTAICRCRKISSRSIRHERWENSMGTGGYGC
jgi:hypothetical protein